MGSTVILGRVVPRMRHSYRHNEEPAASRARSPIHGYDARMPRPLARIRVNELMDAPGIDAEAHRLALRGLARLNRLARSDAILWPALKELAERSERPIRVLDVATGSGDIPVRLAGRARAEGLKFEWHVCDVSERAIRAVGGAVDRARRAGVEIEGHVCDVVTRSLPGRYDAVVCSLFLHHLDEPEVRTVLHAMANATNHLLLVSDLRRTRAGLAMARAIPRLVTRSHIVHFDAAASVRAAYLPDELARLAADAGIVGARIHRAWPQRMLLVWNREN
jgi:2-polyprenyl-3-methyl-5-hydroxy-6-metoxy-1,4-benzoquinol methylase